MKDNFPFICFTTSAENESDYLGPFDPNTVPVIFEWHGKNIRGTLNAIPGAASYSWDLMVSNHYWGKMIFYSRENEWRFLTQNINLEHLADQFAEAIMVWEFIMILEGKRSRFNLALSATKSVK